MNATNGSYNSARHRSTTGCWTCKLRRKKCDERHPICDTCAALKITCYYNQDKPDWLDGGLRQEEMAEKVKQEVKENAPYRRAQRPFPVSDDYSMEHDLGQSEQPSELSGRLRPGRSVCRDARGNVSFDCSDAVLVTFCLETLFPFLFPFYQPSPLTGGKAWILEMIISRPVVRQAILCQSSYFFSLAQGTASSDELWEAVLLQTGNAFEVLRQAIQILDGSSITEHFHGAVRTMTSIVQIQRLEIAVSSFENCRAHLDAGLTLFEQIMFGASTVQNTEHHSVLDVIMTCLLPKSPVRNTQIDQVLNAEQAAFCFSSALLIFDDIIASTILQDEPKLYEYHQSLLRAADGTDSSLSLQAVVGCEDYVLMQIAEIAVLEAWKQRRRRSGQLDVMELVHRATMIKDLLTAQFERLESEAATHVSEDNSLVNVLIAAQYRYPNIGGRERPLVTLVWTHAALLYLSVVVSGWQPARSDVRYHVDQIIDLLTNRISSMSLLRTMVWPFCVAGCLAEPTQEAHFRSIVEALQPSSLFRTVRKALDIMEDTWQKRDVEDAASRDLASCFRSHGDLVLLV